ncbi:MAG: hypothetical protein QF921_15400 [Pseudomonadales bacterium]|nr:hypothetical protein [Pseudomonadales bacterium]MDP6472757.1 hypothetical protein [Pseudomonadales bacterium]MDP6827970.1 hypothetical protein [Pseudomonadales bacterium]MDP6972869.1 hypothetical protein [Pseudomonadales bacterium]
MEGRLLQYLHLLVHFSVGEQVRHPGVAQKDLAEAGEIRSRITIAPRTLSEQALVGFGEAGIVQRHSDRPSA